MFAHLRALLALSVLVALGAACAHAPEAADADSSVDPYTREAKAEYNKAAASLDSGDYPLAIQLFERVRTRYAYSEYGPLAEVGIADTLFAQGSFLEARQVYGSFAQLRPGHDAAEYAAFREGLSLYRHAPKPILLFPPDYEKDLGSSAEAVKVLSGFLGARPEGEYAAEARGLVAELRRQLADRELYVADFYRRQGKWRGVVFRLEGVRRQYGGVGHDDRVRLELAEALLRQRSPEVERARGLLEEVEGSTLATPKQQQRSVALKAEADKVEAALAEKARAVEAKRAAEAAAEDEAAREAEEASPDAAPEAPAAEGDAA